MKVNILYVVLASYLGLVAGVMITIGCLACSIPFWWPALGIWGIYAVIIDAVVGKKGGNHVGA